MLADGFDQKVVKEMLDKERLMTLDRNQTGAKAFRLLTDVAPAMGMVGTLIGLIQMLSNMDDPSSIGPAMAVALLTTLYGVLLANIVAKPIAEKLEARMDHQEKIQSLWTDALIAIQEGKNPRIVEQMLLTYLPDDVRDRRKGAARAMPRRARNRPSRVRPMARQTSRRNNEIPAWMVTYADLMSLLLCFFVLLLSFAEIDLERFKQLAGEMSKAFGVQREVPAEVIPMGSSAVMDRFSPAEPEPTLRDEVRQTTTLERPWLDTHRARQEQRLEALKRSLEERLRPAIEEGGVKVARDGNRVVIRVNEQASFPSGSAEVTPSFAKLLGELSATLADAPGSIAVRGHTDNVPVRSSRYASNWNLSAMRSAVVANRLLQNEALAAERLTVTGHADTRPIASNDTVEGRARNRRVEIIIRLGDGEVADLPSSLSGPAVSHQTLPGQALSYQPSSG